MRAKRKLRIRDRNGEWIYWAKADADGTDKSFVDWTIDQLTSDELYYRKAEPVVKRDAAPKVRLDRPVGRPRLNPFQKYGQTLDIEEAARTVHRIYLIWQHHFGRKQRGGQHQTSAVGVAVEYFKSLGVKVTAEAVEDELYGRHLAKNNGH